MEATYLGIDLAWADTNLSGCCALGADGMLLDERLLRTDDEILQWIDLHTAARTVLAVDAPLLVPNETGRRRAEIEVQRDFGPRKAGPHSTNRSNLIRVCGRIRGEDLAEVLHERGFGSPWDDPPLTVIDVFPHPAIVEIFGLPERHVYKAKPGITVARRRDGLRRLDAMLGLLANADPPLQAPSIDLESDARGKRLKEVEDLLDARLCAWIASAWDRHGRGRLRLYGDRETGHIAVPMGRFISTRAT